MISHIYRAIFSLLILAILPLSASAAPFAYITNYADGTVSVIDTSTNTVVDTVTVGTHPWGVAVNHAGTRVYVSLGFGDIGVQGAVAVIDTTTTPKTVMPAIPVGKEPFGIAINLQGTRVYVANNGHGFSDDTVSVIDISGDRNVVIDTITLGVSPASLTVNPAGTRLYVINSPASTLSVINVTSDVDTVAAPVSLNGSNGASGIVVNSSGTRAYAVGPDSGQVHVLDITTSPPTVTEISVGGRPQGVAISPNGGRVYVTDGSGTNRVFVIATTSNSLVDAVTVTAAGPFGVSVDPTGAKVYTAGGPNLVSVIDTTVTPNRELKTVTVGNNPVAFGQFTGSFCSDTSLFAAVIQNGVAPPNVSPGHIYTSFQPADGLTLRQTACLGGYDHFNWLQTVTLDTAITNPVFLPDDLLRGLTFCFPGYVSGVWTVNSCGVLPIVPYFDPPRGGYVYQGASASNPVEDNFDWYEDEVFSEGPPFVIADNHSVCTQLRNAENAGLYCSDASSKVLGFADEITCQLPIVGVTCTVNFSTVLVGVRSDKTWDVLSAVGTGFDWHVVGTTIGVDQRRQGFQPDPGTLVYFDGFKQSGAAGFSQPELELFAKNGIKIRDNAGTTIPVIIDIKPGGFPNSINPQNLGRIPVAIISTTGFQAPSQVDQKSLAFGHTGNEQSLASCNPQDVNGDGILDLICQFNAPLTGFQPGDTAGVLKGKTLSGTSIYGTDSVVIVPSP